MQISELPFLRATGKGDRISAELDVIQFALEMALDGQRWVRTGPLGSPFIKGTLIPTNQRGF